MFIFYFKKTLNSLLNIIIQMRIFFIYECVVVPKITPILKFSVIQVWEIITEVIFKVNIRSLPTIIRTGTSFKVFQLFQHLRELKWKVLNKLVILYLWEVEEVEIYFYLYLIARFAAGFLLSPLTMSSAEGVNIGLCNALKSLVCEYSTL